MKNFEFSTLHFEDTIQVEDLTDRIEELESELEEHHDAQEVTLSFEYALQDVCNFKGLENEFTEFTAISKLVDELEGLGGDHQWRGNWYPQTLIRESYFETEMDEMVASCYELPKLPDFMTVVLDYRALQQDYSSVDVNGIDYFCR